MMDEDSRQFIVDFHGAHEALTRSGDARAARQRLVELACELIEGCKWAAITVWPEGREPRTMASTGPVSEDVDHVQYTTGEGPCLRAAVRDSPSWIPDLRAEGRWPAFIEGTLRKTPVRSALAFHLTDAPNRSALNLYADAPGKLDENSVVTGAVFAMHAGVLMAHANSAQLNAELRQAMINSRQIGAAIGILMKTHSITEDHAFAMLRAASNHLNRKLRDIAAEVTGTGALPLS
jgi:hypothetical protein